MAFLAHFCEADNTAQTNDIDYLRLLDDRLMYRIAYKSIDELPTESNEKLVQFTSADQEQYQCLIPTVNTYSKKNIESYTGPTPAQLIQPIYDESICSYKFETYWNYELCHGRYVLQYHEEKENKKRTEYYLGNFVSVSAAMEAKNFDQLSPPTKKIGDEMRAYYPVTYTHGTLCDITGKPRQTIVIYVCEQDARQNIYSFSEISSCQYEMVVLSSELCAHPAFQVIPNKEHEISCFPLNKEPEEDPKPKALLKIEDDNEHQFMQEYALFKDASVVKSTKQIFSKLFQVEEGVIEDGFNQLNAILESIKKASAQNNAKPSGRASSFASKESKKPQPSSQQKEPQLQSPPTEMQQIVHGFWSGEVCLHGGTGWWKYEVCYGKVVNQYHQEVGKPRQNILLGTFNEEVHKAWAQENPKKAVERKLNSEGGQVMQVTHLYTQGDVCPENGAHRSCEVRMRCRSDIIAQKVFIYMLEPSTCQYIVVIESPLFCDALQKVDEFGLLPANAFESTKQTTEGIDIDEDKTKEGKLMDHHSDEEDDSSNNIVKMRNTKVEIGIINQEEIMRIVRNLVQGMDAGDGQVMVDVTKIKLPLGGDLEEEEDQQQQTERGAQTEADEEKTEDYLRDKASGDHSETATTNKRYQAMIDDDNEAKDQEKMEKEGEGSKDEKERKRSTRGDDAGEL